MNSPSAADALRLWGLRLPVVGLVAVSGLSLALGVFREVSVAHVLGASWASDSFYVATLPILLLTDLGTDLTIALVPLYVTGGVSSALSRRVLWQMLVLGGVLACLVAMASPLWTRQLLVSAPSHAVTTTTLMVWTLLPAMVVVFTTSAWKARANSTNQFLVPAAAGLLPSIFLVLSAALVVRFGLISLSIGLCSGLILQWAILRTSSHPISEYRPSPGVVPLAGRTVMFAWLLVVLGTAFTKMEPIAQRAYASAFGGGTISALVYAQKIAFLPNALLTLGLATVTLPDFARHSSRQASSLLVRTLTTTALLLLSASAILWLSGRAIVRVLLQHGRFNSADSVLVSSFVDVFVFGMVPIGASILLARYVIARGRPWAYAAAGLTASAVYLTALPVAAELFGPRGLAVASVAAHWTQAAVLGFLAWRLTS